MTTGCETIRVKQGDVGSTLFGTLYRDGTVVDLTDASEVRLHIGDKWGNRIVDEAVTILDPTVGSVSYEWQAADLARIGPFLYEYEVTWSDGAVTTYPDDRVGFDCIISRQLG